MNSLAQLCMQVMSRCLFRDDDSLCCEGLMSALMQIHQNRYTLEHDGKIPAEKSASQCAYQNAQ